MKIENYETKKGRAAFKENVAKIIEQTGRKIYQPSPSSWPFRPKLKSDGSTQEFIFKHYPGVHTDLVASYTYLENNKRELGLVTMGDYQKFTRKKTINDILDQPIEEMKPKKVIAEYEPKIGDTLYMIHKNYKNDVVKIKVTKRTPKTISFTGYSYSLSESKGRLDSEGKWFYGTATNLRKGYNDIYYIVRDIKN